MFPVLNLIENTRHWELEPQPPVSDIYQKKTYDIFRASSEYDHATNIYDAGAKLIIMNISLFDELDQKNKRSFSTNQRDANVFAKSSFTIWYH